MFLDLRFTADSNASLSAINDLRFSAQPSSPGRVAILWLLDLCGTVEPAAVLKTSI